MAYSINLGDYTSERRCEYKGRMYYVRDNGAVCRKSKENGLAGKYDDIWTFGKLDTATGYMLIGSERVHRIVCTAFNGEAPSPQHVVDHINTNRQDNRPQNLRWLTKLENALNNPITVKRIIYCCGSIEAFIENPSILKDSEEYRDISWMRRCSPAEAKIASDNLKRWASKPVPENPFTFLKPFNDDVFESYKDNVFESFKDDVGNFDTPSEFQKNIIQRNWITPTEFPPCPDGIHDDPIKAYLDNLTEGCISSRNQHGKWTLIKASKHETEDAIIILSHNPEGIKHYAISKVFVEDGIYYHESLGTFFQEDGGKKYFEIYCGREWTGGECFDDYAN